MGVEKTVPRKAINKKTKKSIVFDEKKRKDFLTGFKKRKDERRKKWNEKVERDLKKEIKKIKEETKSKVSFNQTFAASLNYISIICSSDGEKCWEQE